MKFTNVPEDLRKRLDDFYKREGFNSDHEFIKSLIEEIKAEAAWRNSDHYKKIFETSQADTIPLIAELIEEGYYSDPTQEEK